MGCRGRGETPSLNIGYDQTGPDAGYPMLLLHGWP
jgi:pimeloyl-ACP methyl ester carboxylesterase